MDPVTEFEKRIAEFFGSPYAVAVDSCTHGLELCLRIKNATIMHTPRRTYLSIPMLAKKLGLEFHWFDQEWKDYYTVHSSRWVMFDYTQPNIETIDAAVYWKKDGYVPNSLMCLSFQYKKHLSLGRGGMILCESKEVALQLKKMSYDGRLPNIPWREQDVDTMGYHYYMTPETAQLGLDKLDAAIATPPRQWTVNDWPDISKMKVFKK